MKRKQKQKLPTAKKKVVKRVPAHSPVVDGSENESHQGVGIAFVQQNFVLTESDFRSLVEVFDRCSPETRAFLQEEITAERTARHKWAFNEQSKRHDLIEAGQDKDFRLKRAGLNWTGTLALVGWVLGAYLMQNGKNVYAYISVGIAIAFVLSSFLGRKVVEWKQNDSKERDEESKEGDDAD